MRSMRRFFHDRMGATVVEYGLIAALLSIAIISGAGAFGENLSSMFNLLSTKIEAPPAP
jgi:pilus assembly protein Flp/PilA